MFKPMSQAEIKENTIKLKALCSSDEIFKKAESLIYAHMLSAESMNYYISAFGVLPTDDELAMVDKGVGIYQIVNIKNGFAAMAKINHVIAKQASDFVDTLREVNKPITAEQLDAFFEQLRKA